MFLEKYLDEFYYNMVLDNYEYEYLKTLDEDNFKEVYNLLKDDLDIMLIDGFGHIKRDLVVVPSYVAKGLEFDSVIIYTDEDDKYQEKDKYLFYVACTRAQHNLIIYNNSK